jgi:single-strand DNA-binding protein
MEACGMSTDLNRVFIIGRMTADAELRTIQSGKEIASFTIACNKGYIKDGENHDTTSFFGCIVWGKSANIICEYTKKGSKLAIEGRLQQTTWDDQDGKKRSKVEIVVDNFQFLDGKKSDSSTSEKPTKSDNHGPDSFEENPFSDSEIPF